MPLLAVTTSALVWRTWHADAPAHAPRYPAGAGELQLAVEAALAERDPPEGVVATAMLYLVHLACPATFALLWALQRQERRAQARGEEVG